MTDTDYNYTLELMRTDSTRLGFARVDPDWEPAIQHTRLSALRVVADTGLAARVRPVWHAELGEPHVRAFSVVVETRVGRRVASIFPITFLSPQAQDASASLVEKGDLKTGERFLYSVLAHPQSSERARSAAPFEVEDSYPCPPVIPGTIADFAERAAVSGPIDDLDVPVFIPRSVIEEVIAQKARAGESETGGVLVGRLMRDAAVPEVFLHITAQIPARHTQANRTRLTFTADTWSEARRTLELRGGSEILAGWQHTHPVRYWSDERAGEPENRSVGAPFFSADDCSVHRTVFAQAYCVALLVSDTRCEHGGWKTEVSLFGWRRGAIAHRGFYIMDEPGSPVGALESHRCEGGEEYADTI